MKQVRILLVLIIAALASASLVRAEEFGQPAFRSVWERTDYPVATGRATHSWVWGPEPFTAVLQEWYAEGAGQRRPVQYIDKSRMEINDPNADPNSPWYVTNGLLPVEIITGQVQVGNSKFIPLQAANTPVVGDPGNDFPTYASLIRIYNAPVGRRMGDHVTSVFLPEGANDFPQYTDSAATEIVHIERDFGIPRAFWDFMNQRGTIYQNGQFIANQPLFNWLYVVGYPITDAFWTRASVGGVERDVMFQAFERRLLTYVPDNPQQYQVEMGNVGRHYYEWRYASPFSTGAQAVITNLNDQVVTVQSPLLVQGFENGTAFEGGLLVRLRTADGQVLAEQSTTVWRPDVGIPGPFETTLTFTAPPQDAEGVVEVVITSPRDGAETVIASRDVTILGQVSGTGSGAPQSIVDLVTQQLASRLSISTEAISVVEVEAVEWRDSSLGCPAPDRAYNPVITPGYRIVLEAQGTRYEYHTDMGAAYVLCQNGQPVA